MLRLTSNPYNSTQNGFLSFPAAYRSSGSEKSTNTKKQKKTLKVMKNKKGKQNNNNNHKKHKSQYNEHVYLEYDVIKIKHKNIHFIYMNIKLFAIITPPPPLCRLQCIIWDSLSLQRSLKLWKRESILNTSTTPPIPRREFEKLGKKQIQAIIITICIR